MYINDWIHWKTRECLGLSKVPKAFITIVSWLVQKYLQISHGEY